MSTPMIRTNFSDLLMEDALPALDDLTKTEYGMYRQYRGILNIETSSDAIEQSQFLSGFGLARRVNATPGGEGGPISFDTLMQGFPKTFKHDTWGLGYAFTKELVDDEKWGIVRQAAVELGRSFGVTQEIDAASLFNNGFSTSYPGPDGAAFFSTSHPRKKAGGNQRNKPTVDVDLDYANLQSALTDIRGWTDDAGKLWVIQPKRLIVPPQLEFVAAALINTMKEPGTANNDVNVLMHRDRFSPFNNFVVWDYLTDTDAWFVECQKHYATWYDREKFNTDSWNDPKTRAKCTGGWARWSHGIKNWLGFWGSQGG